MRMGFFVFYLFLYSGVSYSENISWKNECVGYYQLQLPNSVDVGIYPVERLYSEDVIGIKAIFGKYYRLRSQGENVSSPYSEFYYENYRVMMSDSNLEDLNEYKNRIIKLFSFHDNSYYIKEYSSDVFFLSYEDSHSLYVKKDNRLYQFIKGGGSMDPPLGGNKNNLNFNNSSDVTSLLGRFRTRKLYELPAEAEKGFCLPYGFIANDSGSEERDIAVTYRMKEYPDVMIVFQDASYQLPNKVPLNSDLDPVKDYDAKDYAKWLWNHVYMMYPGQKRELLSPGWFSIKMDGRKGSGSFLEVTRKDGKKDFGYLAFVRADPKNSTQQPDLQVYVSSYSFLVTEGHPQISPDELKVLAEHIVNSVRHR